MTEILRAAWVIARRDFTAIIFSKAFFFFLLGPLFPLAIVMAAGGLGSQVAREVDKPVIGYALSAADSEKLLAARAELDERLGERAIPELVKLDTAPDDPDTAAQFDKADRPLVAIWSGSLAAPKLTGAGVDVDKWQGRVQLLAETAQSSTSTVSVAPDILPATRSIEKRTRLATAQGGQIVLILLVMILAGMVLSNLVEEKTNKIIEILAAAIPMESIFLGKLFAMLGMALVGIACWTALGVGGLALLAGGSLPSLPPPAIGWPLFIVLLAVYFSMAYLLLGSLFLGIGSLAGTVREVQTLSMPVTMGQLLVFFLAAFSVTQIGQPVELFAVAFPLSSPFAMIARAAQMDNLWQHALAIGWQALWVAVVIRIGVMLFRRNVMKTRSSRKRRKPLFARA